MLLETPRLTLRDFTDADRPAFVGYQTDPRTLVLYPSDAPEQRANALFDRFLAWREETPRLDLQLGIFERAAGGLLGSAGLRRSAAEGGTAVFGLELAPDQWGRYRLAVEAAAALVGHGFRTLGLHAVVGMTASDNGRVEKLARWFGAEIAHRHDGPEWMTARGRQEVVWSLDHSTWERARKTRRLDRILP